MCVAAQEIAYDAQNITPAEINRATFIPVVINYVQEARLAGVEGKGGCFCCYYPVSRVDVCVLKLK